MNNDPTNPRNGAPLALLTLYACASPVSSLVLPGRWPHDPVHIWAVVVLVSVAMVCQTWYQVAASRRP
ncbi:hypothetical protein CP973_02480 [Streptomyces albofaciens JCM 4342]|uniref:hypothetical protein n=1 Tax=Streptomyces albofaciens TaxID=66866 RepID=UPI001238D1B3|nr:hypothetical protein [Streptomyces albofaciens]KAA6220988.1 hypothetical protein CP973_02480 [Streptomyces albofaciens JCM 4342]